MQYNRPRPHIIVVLFFWFYRFHRAPAMSIVKEMPESRYKPATIWCLCCFKCSCLSLWKCILSCRLDGSDGLSYFFFSQSTYLYIKNAYTTFLSQCLFSTLHVPAVKVRLSLSLGVRKSAVANFINSVFSYAVLAEVKVFVFMFPVPVLSCSSCSSSNKQWPLCQTRR